MTLPNIEASPEPAPLRHPEKAARPDQPSPRKPPWIRVKAPTSPEYQATRRLMRELKLNTVCEEAACPNIGECWKEKHATVMILGSVCTRACAFCNVATGRPDRLDPHEPERVAAAAAALGLSHIVVTSVDRDDLDDGGAGHFARTITAIRAAAPRTTIGQYLQPTPKHHPITRFVTPEAFETYRRFALGKGFLMVSSSPLTRSSYHAGEDFAQLRAARAAKLAAAG